jgi:hypothetical protein
MRVEGERPAPRLLPIWLGAVPAGSVRDGAGVAGLAGRASGAGLGARPEQPRALKRGIVALVFRCRPAAGEATATDESRRVAWFTPDDVRQHMVPAYAIRVLDALDGGVAARAHDGVHMM